VALFTVGLLTALHSAGFDLEPIMAVGGVSTVFIGFGSQIVTANAVSGCDIVRCCPEHEPARGWTETVMCTDRCLEHCLLKPSAAVV
jgi:hypothetical protein